MENTRDSLGIEGAAEPRAVKRQGEPGRGSGKAVPEGEHKYQRLFDTVTDAIIVFDAHTRRFLDVNHAALELYGYEREEFLRLSQGDITCEPAASDDSIQRTLAGQVVRIPLRFHRRKDGTAFPAEISGSVFEAGGQQCVCGVIRDVTERRRAEEERKQSQEELRGLTHRLQVVREEESQRITGRIHDGVGQSLTALRISLSSLEEDIPDAGDIARMRIRSMRVLLDEAVESVRGICMELRPRILDELGLADAVEWQVGEFERRSGIRCDTVIDPENLTVDPDVATPLFRTLCEALANVVRHAEATTVEVTLQKTDGKITLRVRDSGRGIAVKDIHKADSFGLMLIRERVAFCGGRMWIKGIQGRGTVLRVVVPAGPHGGREP